MFDYDSLEWTSLVSKLTCLLNYDRAAFAK